MSSHPLYAWVDRPDGRVFNNLTIPDSIEGRKDLAAITGEKLMAVAERAGARVAIFDSKAQWYAFHPTHISQQHPGLAGRDLVAELIAAGKRRDIVYTPYVPVDCDIRAWREHPEWRPRKADGTTQDSPGWPRLCQHAARRFMCDYLTELADRYEIGGVWLDGVGLPSAPDYCYCPACTETFLRRHGAQPPTSRETDSRELWSLWHEFRESLLAENIASYRAAAQCVKPGIPVHCGWSWGFDAVASLATCAWHEPSWMWQTATVQHMRAAGAGVAPESYHPAFQYAPSYPWAMTRELLETKAMTCLANGGLPTFTLLGDLETIAAVNGSLAQRAEFVAGAENVPYVGLAFSTQSMNACDPTPFKEPTSFTTYGALKVLLEEKIPEQYVCDRDLDQGGDALSRFAAIVLPDIGYLSPSAQKNLRAYVEAGGGLVALHRTGLFDKLGRQQADFALADLFGAHYAELASEKTEIAAWYDDLNTGAPLPNTRRGVFLHVGDHEIEAAAGLAADACIEVIPEYRRGAPAEDRLVYPDPMLRVRTEPGVERILIERTQTPDSEWPLVALRRHGRGRVAYIAANLCDHYVGHCPHRWSRKLLAGAVRWAAAGSAPPFEIDNAPYSLQATIFRQPDSRRTVVHLLNDPLPFGLPPFTKQEFGSYWRNWVRMREDVIPVANVVLRLRGRFRRVTSQPSGTELPMSNVAGGYTEVVVPGVDIHGLVVADE